MADEVTIISMFDVCTGQCSSCQSSLLQAPESNAAGHAPAWATNKIVSTVSAQSAQQSVHPSVQQSVQQSTPQSMQRGRFGPTLAVLVCDDLYPQVLCSPACYRPLIAATFHSCTQADRPSSIPCVLACLRTCKPSRLLTSRLSVCRLVAHGC